MAFANSCGGCLLGNTYFGYKDERWLSLNDSGSVKGTNPITHVLQTPAEFIRYELTARLADAKPAGFDAIEFDNVESYTNRNGFKTTAAQQLAFNQSIANLAHSMRFTVGLKNDLGQATDLQPYFDFAISEQYRVLGVQLPSPGPSGVAEHLREGRLQRRVQGEAQQLLPAGEQLLVQLQLDPQDRGPMRHSVDTVQGVRSRDR